MLFEIYMKLLRISIRKLFKIGGVIVTTTEIIDILRSEIEEYDYSVEDAYQCIEMGVEWSQKRGEATV